MDLIAFVELHLTLIASIVAVMASIGSVYMVADRRWSKLERTLAETTTIITTEVDKVAVKIDSHSKLFDEHARQEQVWMAGIDQHLQILNGHVFEHHGDIGLLKGKNHE